MASWLRGTLAILLGSATWGVLWNLGTTAARAAFPEILRLDSQITHTGILLAYIAYSVVLSMLAGFITVAAAGQRPLPFLGALAALQLTLGIIAEVSYWYLMPAWYHLIFLALVVPATLYGGMLRMGGREGRS